MRPPYWVYVLLLEGNRIYVGLTSDLRRRWAQHSSGWGALCTQPFQAIRFVETISCATLAEAKELETSTYYIYKEIFGPSLVRGAGCTGAFPAESIAAGEEAALGAPWIVAEA
jgi:predicted GIY-YIG superfamily endonuclease